MRNAKKNARDARTALARRKKRSRRRRNGKKRNARSERSEKKEIETARRKNEKGEIEIARRENEKTGNVRTEENATSQSTRNILRGGTKMMMTTGERREAIATRTGIVLLAIDPLTATTRVDLKVRKVGLVYRIGETRARVSHINYLNVINYGLQYS